MRLVLVGADESTAPLYRVRLLARLLGARHEVRVVAFDLGGRPSPDPRPDDFPVERVRLPLRDALALAIRQLSQPGGRPDAFYAMKPRPTSMGAALEAGRALGVPVLLDVDDPEPALVPPYSGRAWRQWLGSWAMRDHPNRYGALRALERRRGELAGITVVSRDLQRQWGGTWVPQPVEPDRFDPRHVSGDLLADWGLADTEPVVFAGAALPNKGVEDALEALQALDRPWRLVIAGPRTPLAEHLARRDGRVLVTGSLPPGQVPRLLAGARAVALPQRPDPASRGQMPIKLAEAMAMARPVVATAVSDIPEVLGSAGWVVPPGDRAALERALFEALAHPDEAARRGREARHRVLRHHAPGPLGDTLEAVLRSAIAHHRARP